MGQAVRALVREEGLRSLWRGNGAAMGLWIGFSAVQFPAYHDITRLLHPPALIATGGEAPQRGSDGEDNTPPAPPVWVTLTAGAGSALVATLATYPLDLIRTRMAGQGVPRVHASHAALVSSLLAERGGAPWGLFRGLAPTLVQVAPSSALTFLLYEQAKAGYDGVVDGLGGVLGGGGGGRGGGNGSLADVSSQTRAASAAASSTPSVDGGVNNTTTSSTGRRVAPFSPLGGAPGATAPAAALSFVDAHRPLLRTDSLNNAGFCGSSAICIDSGAEVVGDAVISVALSRVTLTQALAPPSIGHPESRVFAEGYPLSHSGLGGSTGRVAAVFIPGHEEEGGRPLFNGEVRAFSSSSASATTLIQPQLPPDESSHPRPHSASPPQSVGVIQHQQPPPQPALQQPLPHSHHHHRIRSLVCGALAGTGAKLLTYPLDTVKKRLQTAGESGVMWCSHG